MTASADNPTLTYGDQTYDLNALSDQAKEAVAGLQVAETQIRIAEDTLKLMQIARQTLLSPLARPTTRI